MLEQEIDSSKSVRHNNSYYEINMVTFYRGLCVLVMMSRACLAHGTVATNQDAEMNYNAPADVTINQQIVASNPGAFSASSAYNFNNFVVGAFEPLIFRTKILAVDGTDKNTLLAGDNVLDEYDTWRDGLLDNASVRVYRVMNGSFVLVRNDTIARYRCSGWSGLLNGIVPVKATTAAKIVMEAWYRPNTTTYIGVRAVDVNVRMCNTTCVRVGFANVISLPWHLSAVCRKLMIITTILFLIFDFLSYVGFQKISCASTHLIAALHVAYL